MKHSSPTFSRKKDHEPHLAPLYLLSALADRSTATAAGVEVEAAVGRFIW
jgi:hypothetical protein